MTKNRLQWNVGWVMVGLISLVVLAVLAKANALFSTSISSSVYEVLHDFAAVFIAIAAAYLAYCFQKRTAFLAALRALWSDMIDAKVALISYTHNASSHRKDFGRQHHAV